MTLSSTGYLAEVQFCWISAYFCLTYTFRV